LQQSKDESSSFIKEPSAIEMKAYRDTWGRGTDSYLQWFYETIVVLRDLLAENGSIYVHVGPNMNHYVRAILDEVFGVEQFINEIIWRRAFGHNDSGRYGIIHDVLLFYSKSGERTWNEVLGKPDKEYFETFFDQYDETRGERYQRIGLTAPGVTKEGSSGKPWHGINPSLQGNHWKYPIEKLEQLDKEGRIHWPKNGVPRLKRYESEYKGTIVQDIWTDISKIHNQSQELLGYLRTDSES
jgi:adenine specific DNA methylase Mod